MDPIRDELEDRVEQIFSATEKLREAVGDGKTARQLLESIFRNVHSLKAAAASNDIDNLTQIAHRFENLLHALRTGKARLDDRVLRAFDDTADAMYGSLRELETGNSQSLESLFDRLQVLVEGPVSTGSVDVEVVLNAIPADIWQSLSEEEKHRLEQAVSEGATLFLLNTSFDIATFDQLFQELKTKLSRAGELISTAPKVHEHNPGKIDFRILFAGELEGRGLKKEIGDVTDVAINEVFTRQPATVSDSKTQLAQPEKRIKPSGPQLIRIELEELDRLISSTHQLFRETHECLDQLLEQSAAAPSLQTKVDALDSSFLSLAAELVNLRMVSIERVLQRAFRSGRSVALSSGKEIEFSIVGHKLKIDKSLSDTIADPLIHLVRNAVDHGIETEAERTTAGKTRYGTIRIEATTLQGQTRIRVIDDGRGIDPGRVSDAGRQLGVLNSEHELDIEQSVRMIFRPGFTTASTVSETSGRGVGLDVVEHAIEGMGGSIRVASEPGAGSVFEIRLPVTFSLLDVLIIELGGHRYLIDAAQLESTGASNEDEVSLGKLLALDVAESPVVVRYKFGPGGVEKVSVATEQQLESQQVLVRNLGSHGGRWLGVAGAAELGDGSVALLLDVPALVARYRSLRV
ncbi:MAG TPA: ATP-binding protein [Pyrinomonadaceae bacterium]